MRSILLLFVTSFFSLHIWPQNIELSLLNDFQGKWSPNSFIVAANGDLVVAKNNIGVAMVESFDTINFQLKHRFNPSNGLYGGNVLNQSMVQIHHNGGYIVSGSIPFDTNSYSTPVVFLLNDELKEVAVFKEESMVPPENGERPIFTNVVTRSDGHIIVLYRTLSRSVTNDSISLSVLYEFDSKLNFLRKDTISLNGSFQMNLTNDGQDLMLFGNRVRLSPFGLSPFFMVLDSYTFNVKDSYEIAINNGVITSMKNEGDVFFMGINRFYQFHLSDFKICKYDINSRIVIDSVVFSNDSIQYESFNLNLLDSNLITVITERDFSQIVGNEFSNRAVTFDMDLNQGAEMVIIDTLERFWNPSFFGGKNLYGFYSKQNGTENFQRLFKLGFDQITSFRSVKYENPILNFYPNPTKAQLNFSFSKEILGSKAVIKIYSPSGAVMQTYKVSERIDVSNLPAGIYLISIQDKKEQFFVSKFIKR